jgi:glycosyltransferase involved in cell wall biosynthesis
VERLVLDGMSWDGTHEVLARYRNVVSRIETVEDAGIFPAMNEAARLARGEFILFMNAGDRFHRADSLRALLARKPAGADIVFGDHVWLSGGVEEFRPAGDFGEAVDRLRAGRVDGRWLARFPAHQATLTRTALLRRLRYDTSLLVCADHEFPAARRLGGSSDRVRGRDRRRLR